MTAILPPSASARAIELPNTLQTSKAGRGHRRRRSDTCYAAAEHQHMPDAEGNPVDEAEARAILRGGAGKELREAAGNYVAPLFWGLREEAGGRVLHNGSAFFLRVAEPTLLITAAHVIRQLEVDRAAYGKGVVTQLMSVAFDPLLALVDIDDNLDVATVRVPEELPQRVGKWVYQRQPDRWPPPSPTQGRGLFFAGFPGAYRTESGPDAVEFGLYGGLMTATSVTEAAIVSQMERNHLETLGDLPLPPPNAWLGGLSGSPGWTLTQVGWRLAGVLFEYSQEYELFYFRPATCIGADGRLIK